MSLLASNKGRVHKRTMCNFLGELLS